MDKVSMLVRIGCNSDRSDIMRFIYDNEYDGCKFNYIESLEKISFNYTIEDTQDEIIWLINDKKSYEEMREYYVKS